MIFGIFTLIVALIISAIAAYYSIAGLTAIFSTAVVPIIIMGAALEVGKITAAVWLKLNWARAKWTYKLYLVPAVAVLMLLTSMGIFGFLSKAHSDQSLVTGNSGAQLALFDEKIKTQRENIDTARKSLAQLDAQVNERLSRGTSEQGVERAAQLRRQQAAERTRLMADISKAQVEIQKLNEDRAPVAAQLRQVESEVGPIKYIAQLVYGPNPNADILEKAVSWMIIVIVAVFDPLALVLILAAQQSINWSYLKKQQQTKSESILSTTNNIKEPIPENVNDSFDISKHPYLTKPWVHFPSGRPLYGQMQTDTVKESEPNITEIESTKKKTKREKVVAKEKVISTNVISPESNLLEQDIQLTDEQDTVLIHGMKIKRMEGGYFEVNDKKYSQSVFAYMWPEIAKKYAQNFSFDNATNLTKTNFGTQFNTVPTKGDLFLRTDYIPSKLFKYNGSKWIEVDKNKTDSYTYDDKYIQFLIDKIQTGEYEIDQLSAIEQDLVAEKLKK